MKKFLYIILLSLLPMASQAREYKGTLYVGESLVLESTRVELVVTKNNTATLKLYKVKFSKWMPVRVNIEIHNVSCDNGSLKLDHGTPTMDGKPYEKRKVANLTGRYDEHTISFTMKLGKSQVRFKCL